MRGERWVDFRRTKKKKGKANNKVEAEFKVKGVRCYEMRIGQLAEMTGLSCSRIRFYESKGLIQARRGSNGYRQYPAESATLLALIANAQRAGFSLEEIKYLVPLGAPGSGWRDDLLRQLHHKLDDLSGQAQRVAASTRMLEWLVTQIECRPAGSDGSDCQEYTRQVIAGFARAPFANFATADGA